MLPHAFKRIRLNLARSTEFPSGSAQHGYELIAPLDGDGHLDAKAWHAHRDQCRVVRFWGDEEHEIGRLVHKPGGQEHARWVFDYDPKDTDDDESGYRLGSHRFAPGEYVTIHGHGDDHTFRVVSVQSAT